MPLKTAQIGRCGELLVQYALLMRGIESAPMSTDSGVDLVAYAPKMIGPVTIRPRRYAFFTKVESEFYLQIDYLYEQRIKVWADQRRAAWSLSQAKEVLERAASPERRE